MALGYCMTCDKLVSIRPGPARWGSRERDWYPVPHDAPAADHDVGADAPELCGGDKRAIR